MTVFVDTSALYALMDRDDQNHTAARKVFASLAANRESLVTTNYVVIEITALVQHRLGFAAVKALLEEILGVIEVHYVDAELHRAATASLLTAGRRVLSFADCISFQLMRVLSIDTAFAFDRHFQQQGFSPAKASPSRKADR